MTSLLELNKIIEADDMNNSVLVTLLDGRCGLVDKNFRNVVVEILVDSFYKWMDFPDNLSEEDIKLVKEILSNPNSVGFGPLAKEYLTDEEVKKRFDKFKKDMEYDY